MDIFISVIAIVNKIVLVIAIVYLFRKVLEMQDKIKYMSEVIESLEEHVKK